MRGPAIFLAQFAGSEPPFDELESMAHWAAGRGYVGVQVPTSDPQLFDLNRATGELLKFRSPGGGQIDFRRVSSLFAQYGYPGWAVLQWECCLKHPEDGAREGAPFIHDHMIRRTDRAFDDFAGSGDASVLNAKILGLTDD